MANYRMLGRDFSTGLRVPLYTNGRLLTAEDLAADQATTVTRQAEVGRAAGWGIVDGFAVEAAAGKTALRIGSGLGLNRNGDVVQLAAASVTLPVQPVTPPDSPLRRAPRFEPCSGEEGAPPASTAAGAYLLTAAPAAQLEGLVPVRSCAGTQNGTRTSDCANQWQIEGVEFKIIRLPAYTPPTGSRARRNRNLLAHWFYGSDDLVTLMRDPLQFGADYSGFHRIAAADFTACDLPLAVFFWTDGRIAFVDQWAVRRRLVHAYPASRWAANLSDERQAEGQARFLQFQEQLAGLQDEFGAKTAALRAVDHFGYLPPVGFLPVNPFALIVADLFNALISEDQLALIERLALTAEQVLEQVRAGVLNSLGDNSAFSLEQFFGRLLPEEYQIVHEDVVHDRLHQSAVQPPIPLPLPASEDPPVDDDTPAEDGLFEYRRSDGVLLTVKESNFDVVLENISSKFAGPVWSFAQAAPGAPPNELGVEIANSELGPWSAVSRVNPASKLAALRSPRAIFTKPRRSRRVEVEPLVDILVIDELVEPYRAQLAETMSGRIDDAIASLSGAGGVAFPAGIYSAVKKAVANAFTLDKYLWKAAQYGRVDYTELVHLINTGTDPVFYVVFVRHQPAVVRRPLRI